LVSISETIQGFATVRETELARHCCLHNDGTPTDDYLQHTECRLVKREKITIDLELLDQFIKELAGFGRDVTREMKLRRQTR
jgi:hypothetical protein